jgi:hypothetical protein
MRSRKPFSLIFLALFLGAAVGVAQNSIPPGAMTFRKIIHAEVERTWGLRIPSDVIAVSAGTIQQESAWNPRALSPYAKGLTQFTDSTWADIVQQDPSITTLGEVWNPHAAIRAMVVYHYFLWNRFSTVTVADARWAFVLSSYNGGSGWVQRDQKLCALHPKCSPLLWFDNVELYSARSPEAFKENRGYPRNILKRWVPLYLQF